MNRKNKSNDWTTFGLGILVGILIMFVYWLFKKHTGLPDGYAWCLVAGIGLIIGFAKIWYSNSNIALSFYSGTFLALAVLLSFNLNYKIGWYHALIAVIALLIGQSIETKIRKAETKTKEVRT
ncbi:MAG: hypothetical protein COT26_03500 [Candidatus Kerfeldbacteria bacterium CG08_land_8_20_14_0_20_43_14]|uniref:Uncharacterized protein n=1 Tax=Candidatus Kerfeldbacteria bacterium CG08_land_8_20_14_0_20_43_14 TaxID=2014246 RepID=A0A2H0YPH6_9BACT|nr:MAG: hypothetical protein COT26_03500 [Candidatus Kerfeldbacteria bacterium CG08_land_8_20_14_0_20_43_14]